MSAIRYRSKTLRQVSMVIGIASVILMTAFTIYIANIDKPTSLVTQATEPDRYYTISFGPKGEPGYEWNTAKKLLTKLSENNIVASGIMRYNGKEFEKLAYLGNYDGENYFNGVDFPIVSGEGYYLQFTDNVGNYALRVLSDYTALEKQTYTMHEGWQLVSIPEGVAEKLKIFKAKDLCDAALNQGGRAISIALSKFTPSQSRGTEITEFVCDYGITKDNFLIKDGEAIFVNMAGELSFHLP